MTAPRDRMDAKQFIYFRYFRINQRARRWGLYCTTCGEGRIAPNQTYPPIEHPRSHHFEWEQGRRLEEYQIVYISEGSGLLETDKMTVRVEAGDALLLTPSLWHRYKPDPAVGWHEHWVGFAGETVEQIFRSGFFAKTSPVVRIRNEKTMLECFRQLFYSVRENPPAVQQILAGQTSMLLSLIWSSAQPSTSRGAEANGLQGVSHMVEHARSLMMAERTREMPLKEIAKALNVSYSSFRRNFREHTGISPHQYRLHLKVSTARELLRTTKLSVKEIAYRCGFEDEQYFCRIFKQQTGKTPSNFR